MRLQFADVALGIVAACAIVITVDRFRGHKGNSDRQPTAQSAGHMVGNWDQMASGRNTKGPEDAQVTIVEFGDFQCPVCAAAVQPLQQLVNAFPKDLRVVYRHWPLDYHVAAGIAARAAECAASQDKFWEYHDLLYEEQRNIPSLSMLDLAVRVGISDTSAFSDCIRNEALLKRVVDEGDMARTAGGRGTPTWVVNGKMINRMPDSALVAQLLDEMSTKR